MEMVKALPGYRVSSRLMHHEENLPANRMMPLRLLPKDWV